MDIWTFISALGILTVTIYYDNWMFEHFVLDILYLSSPYNTITIKNAIIEIVNNLNIANHLIEITSNNEAKMIAATKKIGIELDLQGFQHYHCAAHILNLIVEAVLLVSIILEPLKKLRIFISIIRHSSK